MSLTEIRQEIARDISNQVDAYLFGILKAKPEDLKIREDLKKFSFKCPHCKITKSATELVILEVIPDKQLITRDLGNKVEVTFHRKIGVCCRECSNKIQIKRRWI